MGLLCIAFAPECCKRDEDSLNSVYESGARSFPMLKPIAVVAAAGIVLAGAAQAIPLTARTVCVNCLGPRSDVFNPLEGTNDTPVPNGLIAGSGYTRDELQAGLTKSYSVDVVAVADFLYSDKGVQFLGTASARTTTPLITASRRRWKLCAAPSSLTPSMGSCPASG